MRHDPNGVKKQPGRFTRGMVFARVQREREASDMPPVPPWIASGRIPAESSHGSRGLEYLIASAASQLAG